MANIRTKLIHLLGGVTKKENEGCIVLAKMNAGLAGERRATQKILDVMSKEYGNPMWGETVYKYVKESFKMLTAGDKYE